ncbi:MAG: glycosyltransferase [Chitinophagaceae bacterium]|nr:glycosyltransferase [Chitinophagaceae bacterium]
MQNNTKDTIMPNSNDLPVVLWLASWYPCKIDRFNGDFIQRAARAVSQKIPVHVFYLMKDESGDVTGSTLEETTQAGNLTETRLYYHPPATGIRQIDQVISAFYYTRLGRKWLKNFRKVHYRGKPWIVEVGVAMRAGTLALWMKKKWNQSYVVQEHWTGYYRHLMPSEMQRGKLFWKMTQRILSNADALLPDSRHLGEWINETLLKIPFTEIPNVVDSTLFYLSDKKNTYDKNPEFQPFTFIHVSTLGYQKNTDGLLNSFSNFLKENPDVPVILEIVGPGYLSHLKRVEEDEFLKSSVVFTGPLSYEMVAERMRRAHALVLFSRYENLPCVMLEALCCGLPVIATRVGGIAYHLGRESGIIVESGNEQQLTQAIKDVFVNYHQYNRQLIALKAKTLYGMETIGDLYLKTYQKLYPHLW